MASRRLRESFGIILSKSRIKFSKILISPLSNDYADYLTTFEEYQEQRYEAASTVFGPNSLQAVQYNFAKMAKKIISKQFDPDSTLRPPDNRGNHYSTITPVLYDLKRMNYKDGEVIKDVEKSYKIGDTVTASFNGANPRNFQEKPFMEVEKFDALTGDWILIEDDSSWNTKFHWKR